MRIIPAGIKLLLPELVEDVIEEGAGRIDTAKVQSAFQQAKRFTVIIKFPPQNETSESVTIHHN